MTSVVHALQLERASESLSLGLYKRDKKEPAENAADPLSAEAKQAALETDKQIQDSDQALAHADAIIDLGSGLTITVREG